MDRLYTRDYYSNHVTKAMVKMSHWKPRPHEGSHFGLFMLLLETLKLVAFLMDKFNFQNEQPFN